MRLDIRYRTLFSYDDTVRESQNELRACPVTDDRQQLLAYRVSTSPSARTLSFTDYWGTRADHFGVSEPHTALEVVAEAAVETQPRQTIETRPDIDALRDVVFRDQHGEFLERSRHTDWSKTIAREAARILERNRPDVVRTVLAVHGFAHNCLRYVGGSTEIGQPIEDIVAGGTGVCQDYAHLAVALCRSIGIPARYVSGYLFTTDDSTGAEAGDRVRVQTHAWFEAAIPGAGWIPLDPTNRLEVGHQHVKIGHGRDYDDVPPLRGSYSGGGRPEVEAVVEIRRMDPTRQPTTLVAPSAPTALLNHHHQEQQQQQ